MGVKRHGAHSSAHVVLRGYPQAVQDRQALGDAASKADSGPVGTGLCHEGAAVKLANTTQGSVAALCGWTEKR